jgi:hypothetical protein
MSERWLAADVTSHLNAEGGAGRGPPIPVPTVTTRSSDYEP